MLILSCCRAKSFIDIITDLTKTLDTDALKNRVNVVRDNVLDGGLRAFGRLSFNPAAPLNVIFVSEEGQDTGGPSREFLRLAMSGVQDMHIFEGPATKRRINLDYTGAALCHCCALLLPFKLQ